MPHRAEHLQEVQDHVRTRLEGLSSALHGLLFIFFGSMIVGAISGILSAGVFKWLDLRHHDEIFFVEAALSMVFPWAAYYIAESNKLSGIVTILACGMVMATYTRHNFSPDAIDLTAKMYKVIAFIAETYVFVYLGMACVLFPIFDHTVYKLILIATLACFVGRLHIYIGSWLTNCFRSKESVPPAISATYCVPRPLVIGLLLLNLCGAEPLQRRGHSKVIVRHGDHPRQTEAPELLLWREHQ